MLSLLLLSLAALSIRAEYYKRCDHIEKKVSQELLDSLSYLSRLSPAPELQHVPVVWHLVNESASINNSVIIRNFQLLDKYIGVGARLKFKLTEIRRHNLSFGDVHKMKRVTHKGGMETLNVWTPKLGGGLLGFATFPFDQDGDEDGVVVDYRSLLGAPNALRNYDQGFTLVHEVGHWFGLFHTFQGGCARKGGPTGTIQPADVPAQFSPSSGCPIHRDSCRDLPGFDPIHNFMDYSYDACMEDFTLGQYERISVLYSLLRGSGPYLHNQLVFQQ